MNNKNKVRALRQEAGLSRFALAVRAEVTTTTLYMIEGGRVTPRLSTAKRIARELSNALGRKVTLDELFN